MADDQGMPRREAPAVFRSARAAIRRHPRLDRAYRTGVGVVGTGTVALGIVLIPLPGPGALIGVGGLAILGTEFEGARTANVKASAALKKAAAAAKSANARRAARKSQASG